MTYGKLINGKLEYMALPLRTPERVYHTPTHNEILSCGYKEVVYTHPYPPQWHTPKQDWVETNTQIIQTWEYELQQEPSWEQVLQDAIAQKYTIDEQIEMLFEGSRSAKYLERQNYVQEQKNNIELEKISYTTAVSKSVISRQTS